MGEREEEAEAGGQEGAGEGREVGRKGQGEGREEGEGRKPRPHPCFFPGPQACPGGSVEMGVGCICLPGPRGSGLRLLPSACPCA